MTFHTTYCNHGHDLATGVPVGHECYVLPPSGLRAEFERDYTSATEIFNLWSKGGSREIHPGLSEEERGD